MPSERPLTRPIRIVAAAAAVIVILDQVTKSLALERLADGPVGLFWTVRLALTFNRGVAFSMGSGLTPVITILVVCLLGGLLVFARHATTQLAAASLGMLVGGAAGNLADRLFRDHGGAVIDFIDVGWWPVFNVADIGVSVGAVLLLVATFLEERRTPVESRA